MKQLSVILTCGALALCGVVALLNSNMRLWNTSKERLLQSVDGKGTLSSKDAPTTVQKTLDLVSKLGGLGSGRGGAKFCNRNPKLCVEPFHCDKWFQNIPVYDMVANGFAAHGPLIQSWCLTAAYQDYAYECLVTKDLVKAGHLQYNLTKAGRFGANTYEIDGSYCFIEGHCLNTAVTNSTTLEEANDMCDLRYGRKRWTSFGSWGSTDRPGKGIKIADPQNGFRGQHHTAPFLVAACAMGNYHCDVVYCRETYCKDEHMIKKYGHFLSDLGWTESKAPWMHA